MRTRRFSVIRPFIPASLLAVLAMTILSGCSTGGAGPTPTQAQTEATTAAAVTPTLEGVPVGATVELGSSNFVHTTVTLSAGQSLRFVDPTSTGGTHVICLGMNGQCDASAQGPDSLLAPGLSLHPGDTKEIAFPHAGQYDVTCTIHPNMHLTISVLGGD